MTLQAGDNLSDLGRIDNDGDHRHSGSASGADHDVHLVNLGQQPRPSLPAREHADLAVQWPHEERRRNRRFGLMGSTGADLPAEPPVVG